jgi:hypothetical protein
MKDIIVLDTSAIGRLDFIIGDVMLLPSDILAASTITLGELRNNDVGLKICVKYKIRTLLDYELIILCEAKLKQNKSYPVHFREFPLYDHNDEIGLTQFKNKNHSDPTIYSKVDSWIQGSEVIKKICGIKFLTRLIIKFRPQCLRHKKHGVARNKKYTAKHGGIKSLSYFNKQIF